MKLVAKAGETMVTTIRTTEDSMVHREVAAMEATEVAAAVVVVEVVEEAITIPSNNEMTSKTMKKTTRVGDRAALLIIATQTMLLTAALEVEILTLEAEDLEVDSRALTAIDPSLETTTNRKTLVFHVVEPPPNIKLKAEATSIHRPTAQSPLFSFPISHLTTMIKI
jgi:hypothetical protein